MGRRRAPTAYDRLAVSEDESPPSDEIRLTVPALAAYARVVRLAVTGLASRIGFSYDEIEDLRIAVGELCTVLVNESRARITLRCTMVQDTLTVDASRSPVGAPIEVGELSHQILHGLVDEVAIDEAHARLGIVKRRQD